MLKDICNRVACCLSWLLALLLIQDWVILLIAVPTRNHCIQQEKVFSSYVGCLHSALGEGVSIAVILYIVYNALISDTIEAIPPKEEKRARWSRDVHIQT